MVASLASGSDLVTGLLPMQEVSSEPARGDSFAHYEVLKIPLISWKRRT